MQKKALITGVTGQDGSYLAEFLIGKGYEVHGVKRRSSSFNTDRIDHIFSDPHEQSSSLHLHYGDLTDGSSLQRILQDVRPDEVYNLGAQSHVGVSFEQPEYTSDTNALGALRVLEALRATKLDHQVRFYQASSSELFGMVQQIPQSEKTPFYPRSPYAVAKLFAYWMTVNYRESYGMFACNGILFNHESPRRGETFVTRKVTRGICRVALGIDSCLFLGNLDSLRDWGHASDYVEMQWMMLQQRVPKDYVISTGQQHSVREFLCWAAEEVGFTLEFNGNGLDEKGYVSSIQNDQLKLRLGDCVVAIDERYFRPSEVCSLLGDSAKARDELGWKPRRTARELCKEMVAADFDKTLEQIYAYRQ